MSDNTDFKILQKVGYWAETPQDDEELPWPGDYVYWDKIPDHVRETLWKYTEGGGDLLKAHHLEFEEFRSTSGKQRCRLCNKRFPDKEISDGTWSWPVSLYHYIMDHGVVPPKIFVEHVLAVLKMKPEKKPITRTFYSNQKVEKQIRSGCKQLKVSESLFIRKAISFYINCLKSFRRQNRKRSS